MTVPTRCRRSSSFPQSISFPPELHGRVGGLKIRRGDVSAPRRLLDLSPMGGGCPVTLIDVTAVPNRHNISCLLELSRDAIRMFYRGVDAHSKRRRKHPPIRSDGTPVERRGFTRATNCSASGPGLPPCSPICRRRGDRCARCSTNSRRSSGEMTHVPKVVSDDLEAPPERQGQQQIEDQASCPRRPAQRVGEKTTRLALGVRHSVTVHSPRASDPVLIPASLRWLRSRAAAAGRETAWMFPVGRSSTWVAGSTS